jgi:hypothetical protein
VAEKTVVEEQSGVLNLDDLFGTRADIVVMWKDKRYKLKHPQAMGPGDIMQLEQLQKKQASLADSDNADELGEVIDNIIKMIAPSMNRLKLPFLAKMKILQFYQEQLEDLNPKAEAGAE